MSMSPFRFFVLVALLVIVLRRVDQWTYHIMYIICIPSIQSILFMFYVCLCILLCDNNTITHAPIKTRHIIIIIIIIAITFILLTLPPSGFFLETSPLRHYLFTPFPVFL